MRRKFGEKASTTEARLVVNERFPALNHKPVTRTLLRSQRKPAGVRMPNPKTSRSDDWLSVMVDAERRRIKQNVASHSRQKDKPMASVSGKARVDVPATISDRWRALMVKIDAVRRFRSSLARFRSRKAKSEEHLMDDPSM